jgi:hypothetical protein
MAPIWSAKHNAECVFKLCHEDYVKVPTGTNNVTSYPCPDNQFSQFGCDVSGNTLDMYGNPMKHAHLTARAMKFTVKALKHGDQNGWIVPLIVTGVVVSFITLLLFYLFLLARKKVVMAKQKKMIAADTKMEKAKGKGMVVRVIEEEEYSDFI